MTVSKKSNTIIIKNKIKIEISVVQRFGRFCDVLVGTGTQKKNW